MTLNLKCSWDRHFFSVVDICISLSVPPFPVASRISIALILRSGVYNSELKLDPGSGEKKSMAATGFRGSCSLVCVPAVLGPKRYRGVQ